MNPVFGSGSVDLDARRAPLRFHLEGTFRQHMVVKGRNRDTAWFAMLDREWPAVRSAFERWLAPANFDAARGQRVRLGALMDAP